MNGHLANDGTQKKRRAWVLLGLGWAVSAALSGGCRSTAEFEPSPPPIRIASTSVPKIAPSDEGGAAATNGPRESGNGLVRVSAEEVAETREDSVESPRALPSALPLAEEAKTIDLAAAFQLAGMDNPTINLAREVVNEALARQRGAEVLLLPNLSAGANYHKHTGNLQASSGIIRNVDSQDLYVGAGARTLAAESVAFPGVRLFSHLGDAIYEPLAARQQVEVRRSQAFATENQTLLLVAGAYFNLLGAEVRLEALRKSEGDLAELVRITEAYAKQGQGRIGDARRAETNAHLLHQQTQETEGNVASASAVLTGLLSLDPTLRLRTPGGIIQPVVLIDENEKLEKLTERGLMSRPEVRARLQAIAEAQTRVRQERIRPFLPTLSAGFSAGSFGGGSNLTAAGIAQPGGGVQVSPWFGRFAGRTDFDVFAVWTLQNAGAGNRALVNRADAVLGEATAELQLTNNEVREQIAESLADVQTASRQMKLTRTQLIMAE